MDNIKELVERLRDMAEDCTTSPRMMRKSADALEAQQNKIAGQAAEIERLTKLLDKRCDTCPTVERLTMERDAAVEDLELAACCETCYKRGEHGFSTCHDCNDTPGGWKWRGPQKEE